jgi:spore germination protein KA
VDDKKEKLEKDASKVIEHIKKVTGNSPDINVRDLKINLFKNIYLVYSQSVSESDKINDFIMKSISLDIKSNKKFLFQDLFKGLKNTLPNVTLKTVNNYDDLFLFLFSGFCIIILDGYEEVMVFETKANIDRGIEQANSEPIIKGPKDSFTEHFYKNVGLIRKRIKSESLWLEELNIGRQTKTKIGILYMKNIIEEQLVDIIRKRIKNIDIDGIIDIGQLKQLISSDTKTSFPLLLTTERPDLTTISLLKGKVIILVENCPIVIVIPSFLADFFHAADDYYQKYMNITFTRLIRVMCFIISVMVPGYFVALLAFNKEIIPTPLLINIIAQRAGVPFPASLEALIMILAFEILKEGDVRLPTTVGGSLSILGAIVLGQAAVTAGVISATMVIVIAITSMASLVFQSIELINAIRIWRIAFLLFGSTFGIIGMLVGGIFLTIQLCSVKSFGKPYLTPFAPFIGRSQRGAILRFPLAGSETRSTLLTDKNFIRQRKVDFK